MNDNKGILILLKILDQIQQDNEDARNGIEISITTICKEEGISFKQVFYILFFDAVFKLLFKYYYLYNREFILGQPITL